MSLHLFIRYFLTTYHVPGTVENQNHAATHPHELYRLLQEKSNSSQPGKEESWGPRQERPHRAVDGLSHEELVLRGASKEQDALWATERGGDLGAGMGWERGVSPRRHLDH